jgi:hypothetical protein
MTSVQIDLRNLIVQSLELLASKDAAFEYQRTVPIANVPAELFCWWFDDAYHPSSEVFQGAFTENELQVLAAFHSIFEAASVEIREPLPSLEQLLDLPAWQPVANVVQFREAL